MGHPTMQENDTAKLTPTLKESLHIKTLLLENIVTKILYIFAV